MIADLLWLHLTHLYTAGALEGRVHHGHHIPLFHWSLCAHSLGLPNCCADQALLWKSSLPLGSAAIVSSLAFLAVAMIETLQHLMKAPCGQAFHPILGIMLVYRCCCKVSRRRVPQLFLTEVAHFVECWLASSFQGFLFIACQPVSSACGTEAFCPIGNDGMQDELQSLWKFQPEHNLVCPSLPCVSPDAEPAFLQGVEKCQHA